MSARGATGRRYPDAVAEVETTAMGVNSGSHRLTVVVRSYACPPLGGTSF